MPWLFFEVALAGLAWLGMGLLLATATVVTAIRLGVLPRRLRGAATITALLGGSIVAAVLHRFGLEGPFALDIGGRPFPTTWVLTGAVVGVIVLVGVNRDGSRSWPGARRRPQHLVPPFGDDESDSTARHGGVP